MWGCINVFILPLFTAPCDDAFAWTWWSEIFYLWSGIQTRLRVQEMWEKKTNSSVCFSPFSLVHLFPQRRQNTLKWKMKWKSSFLMIFFQCMIYFFFSIGKFHTIKCGIIQIFLLFHLFVLHFVLFTFWLIYCSPTPSPLVAFIFV